MACGGRDGLSAKKPTFLACGVAVIVGNMVLLAMPR
jgi:hypothetical protein